MGWISYFQEAPDNVHKTRFPPLGLFGHQREIGGPKSLCKPAVYFKGEAGPRPKRGVHRYSRRWPIVGQSKAEAIVGQSKAERW